MEIYEFEALKRRKKWTFPNGDSIELPKGTDHLAYVAYEHLGFVMVFPKDGGRGLGEYTIDISNLSGLESKVEELPEVKPVESPL